MSPGLSDGCKHGRCLLSDAPSEVLQMIFKQLCLEDHLSLRHVSHSVCNSVTQYISHITLRLCDRSSPQYVQHWYECIQHLTHVSIIHANVDKEVRPEVFELAMQLLSQRTTPVRELHLVSGPGCSRIPSMHPVQHLLPHLQTLVVHNIRVDSLLSDLQQLAAATMPSGGWQLQSLTVDCIHRWQWTATRDAVQHLAAVFPNLQLLAIKLPTVGIILPPMPQADDHDSDDQYSDGDADLDGLVPYWFGLQRVVSTDSPYTYAEAVIEAATAAVAAVAALVNGIMQLKHLHTLTVTDIPNIWSPRARTQSSMTLTSAVALVARARVHDLLVGPGLLQSTVAAAAAFYTLDDLGCWLLRHPELRDVKITTDTAAKRRDHSMSWQRTQNCDRSSDIIAPYSSSSSSLVHVDVAVSLHDGRDPMVCKTFTHQLSHYSFRPATEVMSHIIRLKLDVDLKRVDELHEVLSNCKSLKYLEVSLQDRFRVTGESRRVDASVVAAAGTVHGLQSLTFLCPKVWLSDDLLLPLTAAAGGPSSNLTRLALCGDFQTAATAAAVDDCSGWHQRLKQLDGLLDLAIHHAPRSVGCMGVGELCRVPVSSLPSSLRALSGCNLDIVCTAATGAAALGDRSGQSMLTGLAESTAGNSLQLQNLHLNHCQMSSPSILMSNQLQELAVKNCTWLGGWAAATAAWPKLRQLTCHGSHDPCSWIMDNSSAQLYSSSNINNTSLVAPLGTNAVTSESYTDNIVVEEALMAMSEGFTHLRSVDLMALPSLSAKELQQIAEHMRDVRHIRIGVNDQAQLHSLSSQPVLSAHAEGAAKSNTTSLGSVRKWLQQQMPWARVIVLSLFRVKPILSE